MRLVTNSTINASFAIACPNFEGQSGTHYYNFQTTGWELPFSYQRHTMLLTPVDPSLSLVNSVLSVVLNPEIAAIPDCIGIMFAADPSGYPTQVLDAQPMPHWNQHSYFKVT